jgi:hypothetical protein
MRMRPTLMLLLATGSLLAGCHKQQEQPTDTNATETVAPMPEAPAPAPEPAPAAKPETKPVTPKAKRAPEPTADQQILDDADATGMTSHATPDADQSGSGAAGNDQH